MNSGTQSVEPHTVLSRIFALTVSVLLAVGLSAVGASPAHAAPLEPEQVTSVPDEIDDLIEYDGLLYFTGYNADDDVALFNFDGATVTEVAGSTVEPGTLVVYDGELYFAGDDGTQEGIYRYDGTVVERLPITVASPFLWLVFDDLLYFTADDGPDRNLYTFDSTEDPAAAHEVANTPPLPSELFVYNNELYLTGFDDPNGLKMYKAGSSTPLSGSPILPFYFTEYDGEIYFTARATISDPSVLYFFTGTNIYQLAGSPMNPRGFLVHDGKLFFLGDDASSTTRLYVRFGDELHVVDGSPEILGGLGEFDGALYFTGGPSSDPYVGVYDGTAFASFSSPPYGSAQWTVYNGTPYFISSQDGFDAQLWRLTEASATSPGGSDGSGPGGELAATGADASLALLAGGGFLLAGVVLVRMRMRMRSRRRRA